MTILRNPFSRTHACKPQRTNALRNLERHPCRISETEQTVLSEPKNYPHPTHADSIPSLPQLCCGSLFHPPAKSRQPQRSGLAGGFRLLVLGFLRVLRPVGRLKSKSEHLSVICCASLALLWRHFTRAFACIPVVRLRFLVFGNDFELRHLGSRASVAWN